MSKHVWTLKQAAQYLGVTDKTVYDKIIRGTLPIWAVAEGRLSGTHYLVLRSAVTAYARSKQQKQASHSVR